MSALHWALAQRVGWERLCGKLHPPLRHCHMGQNENQISGNVQHIIAFGLHREWRVEMASGTGYQMPSPKRAFRKQQGVS
ncbi:hypothetical protein DXM27_19955 [Rhizobium rhizogenes]|uniref:Uncharacterized protein n=1 Tax=Rhizobium rhizogenes TaxID=359 RepID=A0AA88EWQ9_RHIRH|nr:hypothetical protein DXM27_19955 [Rhizobium rhizogenes]